MQSHHKNKNSFNPVMISADCLLQDQKYIHGLKHDVIIAGHSIIPIILHKINYSACHQETICIFEAIKRLYWWPNLHNDIGIHVKKCCISAEIYQIYPNTHNSI